MQRALIIVKINKLEKKRKDIIGKGAFAKKGKLTYKIQALKAKRAALLLGLTTQVYSRVEGSYI